MCYDIKGFVCGIIQIFIVVIFIFTVSVIFYSFLQNEESWSSIGEDLEEKEESGITNPLESSDPIERPGPSKLQLLQDSALAMMQKSEAAIKWMEENTEDPWWIQPDIREIPLSKSFQANWCFHWFVLKCVLFLERRKTWIAY